MCVWAGEGTKRDNVSRYDSDPEVYLVKPLRLNKWILLLNQIPFHGLARPYHWFAPHQASLKRLFRDCGKVRRVYIHKKPTPGLPETDASRFFPTVAPVQVSRPASSWASVLDSVNTMRPDAADANRVMQRVRG